jgi:CheY-like chemotaxis protein
MEAICRLLVVEDDGAIRELIADRLAHFELTFATCQSQAYEQLRENQFDLVLLDLRLPRESGDMRPANQVGIDILGTIRQRRLLKRGSAMPLPVVVMTAHGSESLSAQVLIDHGANDYIPKPFGPECSLEEKIRRALAGLGALVPAVTIGTDIIRLAFSEKDEVVRVETLPYRGAHFGLLAVLRDLYLADLNRLRAPENFEGIRGERLAAKLGISGQAARRRVVKLRDAVKRDLREKLGRVIGDHDIVENTRDWTGYRLNPLVVRVVAWDQMPDLDE